MINVNVDNLGAVGMITDQQQSELPPNAWGNLLNWRCRLGHLEPMDGYSAFTTWTNVGTEDVYAHALESIETGGNYYWVFPYDDDGDGQCEAIYYTDDNGSAPTDITRTGGAYVGTAADKWTTCQHNGYVILNNGADEPQAWDGVSANCIDLPWDATHDWTDIDGLTTPYRAEVIRSHKNVLFALNITDDGTNYPTMVHTSGISDPGNLPLWDYSDPTTLSDRRVLSDTDGACIDAVPLGEQMIVYKTDAIYSYLYVGGTFQFNSRAVSVKHGIWSSNCAVDIGGEHIVVGDGVLYRFDGRQPVNILEGFNNRDFFEGIDIDQYQKVFGVFVKKYNEVWFCYPELGQTWCTKALVYNFKDNTFCYRTIPPASIMKHGIVSDSNVSADAWDDGTEQARDWDDEAVLDWAQAQYSAIGDTVVAASDQLFRFGDGITTDEVTGQRANLMIKDPETWFSVRRMWPRAEGDAISIQIGGQYYIDGPITWLPAKTFDPGTQKKLDWRQTFPVHAVRVTYSGTGEVKFRGYNLDVQERGKR